MKKFKIGLTEQHGMSEEQSKMPPDNIEYEFLKYRRKDSPYFKSPMKGFMSKYRDDECDLVEAVLTPVSTKKPWLYSLACYEEALAFSFIGLPVPKFLRNKYMEYLFLQDRFKGLLFWSDAGKQTLKTYGNVTNPAIWEKSHVVYPAIRTAAAANVIYKESQDVQILFNGNFFIKGGANVVDTFEILQAKYPNISLRLCCNEEIDFHTDDLNMRQHYLERIEQNPAIIMGRVPREELLHSILPNTDIYLLPTYGDAFGFAVLEAMAYGIPVVSTNYMAIPEMIVQGETGFMVNVAKYDCKSIFKGCYVSQLNDDFKEDINTQLLPLLEELISSPELRKKMGRSAIKRAQERFSFEERKRRITEIYKSIF